jgi:hypothetical protein
LLVCIQLREVAARGAVTVDVLTSSSVIEVDRTVSRDGCVGLGGHEALLEASLIGARPPSESLPPPAPPQRAMRRVAANGTVTVAGQRLRIGGSYYGQTVAIAIEHTVFRVLLNAAVLSTHARRPDTNVTILRAYPRTRHPSSPKSTPTESVKDVLQQNRQTSQATHGHTP